ETCQRGGSWRARRRICTVQIPAASAMAACHASSRLVDPVEETTVAEVQLLRLGPSPERVVDGHLRDRPEVGDGASGYEVRSRRAIVMPCRDALAICAVQVLQVGFGQLLRAAAGDVAIDHRDRGLCLDAEAGIDDLELRR